MKIQKVLLTTDLSEEAERPYTAVAELAKQTGAAVTLLHVVEDVTIAPHGAPLAPPLHSPDLPKQLEQARKVLADHAGKFGDGVEVATDVISAIKVGDAIAKYAADNGFDLLAISTHGRTGFRRMVMGSVAEIVLRHAKTPVLVFPRHE
jgi:nucleotide-binding universal stress UspA family protein